MKKFAASILLLLYFVVSTGFVVSIHYCMDRVDAVALGHVTTDECSKCGMTVVDNDGCCKDEVKVLKMQVDQAIAKMAGTGFSPALIPQPVTSFLYTPVYTDFLKAEPVAHGPPLSRQDTYLQNCVFRI